MEADFEVEVEAAEEVDTGTARSRRMEARAATARAAEEATLDCIKVWRPRESGLVSGFRVSFGGRERCRQMDFWFFWGEAEKIKGRGAGGGRPPIPPKKPF